MKEKRAAAMMKATGLRRHCVSALFPYPFAGSISVVVVPRQLSARGKIAARVLCRK